jgi:hypothetical protein
VILPAGAKVGGKGDNPFPDADFGLGLRFAVKMEPSEPEMVQVFELFLRQPARMEGGEELFVRQWLAPEGHLDSINGSDDSRKRLKNNTVTV